MSRIGKLPIEIPKNVTITLENSKIQVKGPHGNLSQTIPKEIKVSYTENLITLEKIAETQSGPPAPASRRAESAVRRAKSGARRAESAVR